LDTVRNYSVQLSERRKTSVARKGSYFEVKQKFYFISRDAVPVAEFRNFTV